MSASKKNNNKDKKKKESFWKKAWYIIANKNTGGEHYLTETMAMLTGIFLNLLAIFSALFAIGGIVFFVKISPTFLWGTINQIESSIEYIAMFLGIEMVLLLLSLMLRGSANEISRQKNKNYVTAVFSGMASFAAMIISLILLIKEFVK